MIIFADFDYICRAEKKLAHYYSLLFTSFSTLFLALIPALILHSLSRSHSRSVPPWPGEVENEAHKNNQAYVRKKKRPPEVLFFANLLLVFEVELQT